MSDISETLKVITSLTGKKTIGLVAILIIMIGMTVAYEIHTSEFQLEKLNSVSKLLVEVEPLTNSKNKEAQELAQKVIAELNLVMEKESVENSVPIDPKLLLILLLSTPWVFLSFSGVFEAFKGESDWYYGTIGCLLIASLYGFIGYSVPIEIHWFYRYVCLPLILTGATLYLFWAVDDEDEESNA